MDNGELVGNDDEHINTNIATSKTGGSKKNTYMSNQISQLSLFPSNPTIFSSHSFSTSTIVNGYVLTLCEVIERTSVSDGVLCLLLSLQLGIEGLSSLNNRLVLVLPVKAGENETTAECNGDVCDDLLLQGTGNRSDSHLGIFLASVLVLVEKLRSTGAV